MINGYIEQAEQVIATARRRYDGKRGNPWDDIECGHNYARSMSAFSLVPLICGFKADMCKCELTFNPRVTERPFKSFWSTASAWGIIEIFDNSTKIIVSDGEIPIRTLNLSYLRTVSSVQLNEQRLRFSFDSGRINLENVILKSRSIIEILEENNG